jgi:hypothetical protein
MEGVYGKGSEDEIAAGLYEITDNAESKAQARAAQAGYHAIRPSGSYEADGTPRWMEEQAPTRLGDPVKEWVLVVDGKPINSSIAESTVRLRATRLKSTHVVKPIKIAPWQKQAHLVSIGNGWSCRGVNPSGSDVEVHYDRARGLTLAGVY